MVGTNAHTPCSDGSPLVSCAEVLGVAIADSGVAGDTLQSHSAGGAAVIIKGVEPGGVDGNGV